MNIEIEKGFVVVSLAEYERLKEAERLSKELWEEHIRHLLRGEIKNGTEKDI